MGQIVRHRVSHAISSEDDLAERLIVFLNSYGELWVKLILNKNITGKELLNS